MPASRWLSLAKVISASLNAPLVAAYTFVILVGAEGREAGLSVLGVAVFFAALVPIAILFILAKKKMIPDLYASDRRSRVVPFLAAVGSYAVGFGLLLILDAPPSYQR